MCLRKFKNIHEGGIDVYDYNSRLIDKHFDTKK